MQPRREGGRSLIRMQVLLAVAILALVGIAAAVILLGGPDDGGDGGRDSPRTDGATVELPPPPADSSAVQAYLRGEGAAVLRFVELTDPVVEGEDADCQTVAEALDGLGPPADILARAGSVPDETTAVMLTNDISATMDLLADCGAEEDAQQDAVFSRAVTDRQLRRLGLR